MKRALMLFFLLELIMNVSAQQISIPELFSILDLPASKIDTLMKQKEYRLMQKESDSGAVLVYYTNLERNPNGASWVRSLSYREIILKEARSRMVNYRTYRKKEYQELMEWLLVNSFKTVKQTNYGEYIETSYSDGMQSLSVKQTRQKLPSGVTIWSYEFGAGK